MVRSDSGSGAEVEQHLADLAGALEVVEGSGHVGRRVGPLEDGLHDAGGECGQHLALEGAHDVSLLLDGAGPEDSSLA